MCCSSLSSGSHVALTSRSTSLWLHLPPRSPSCPTCLQGLQRANRCGRAFEISMPYKFKVFGNGFLINLPTLSSWKRQKSQIHSRFNLPWYFLSRWLKSCLSCVLYTSTEGLASSLQAPGTVDSLEGQIWLPVISTKVLLYLLDPACPPHLPVGHGETSLKPRYFSIPATLWRAHPGVAQPDFQKQEETVHGLVGPMLRSSQALWLVAYLFAQDAQISHTGPQVWAYDCRKNEQVQF